MKEEWRDIKGYEGYYQVSNLGKIKSLARTTPHKMNGKYTYKEFVRKPNKVAFDYLQITLTKNNKRKSRYVHNLVMEAFVGEKPEGFEVNHKDEDKSNNKLDNLEYLTRSENNRYGTRLLRVSAKNTNGKKSVKIKGTHLRTGEVIEFPSISEAKRNGYGNHISDVINGKRNQCHGYKWERV